MVGKHYRLFLTLSAMTVVSLIFMASGSTEVRADQIDEICQKSCSSALGQYQKQKGSPPPAGLFDACMQNCKATASIRSEADISPVCKANCQRMVRAMNEVNGPGMIEECIADCVKRTKESFRNMMTRHPPPQQPGK